MKLYIDAIARNKRILKIDHLFGKYTDVEIIIKPEIKPLRERINDALDVLFGRQTAVVFAEDCRAFPVDLFDLLTKKPVAGSENTKIHKGTKCPS